MDKQEDLRKLETALNHADAIVIGSGAGLSAAAGFTYSGERFEQYFRDFAEKYHFRDMYSGGFYPYATLEEYWAFWSRYIYINRYAHTENGVYKKLVQRFDGRECFSITTNVDHQWQGAGWDKRRLFYTQGDYGLFQCSRPCHHSTYDNEETVRKMVLAQGYEIAEDGALLPPTEGRPLMRVPSELVPRCPVCHKPMSMNLRSDSTFVQDGGWEAAAERYRAFLNRHRKDRVVYLELGVGYNTPGIIKYSFWRMTYENPKAVYACVNLGEAAAPSEIKDRSICVDGDIRETLIVLGKLHR